MTEGMERLNFYTISFMFLAGTLAGCSTSGKSPDVSGNIRKSLDGAGFRDVSVSQDREKGVVTLNGHVPSENDKTQAESIVKAEAAGQVVSDQIAVLPPGGEREAKRIDSDTDKAIEKNLDAALVQHKLQKGVSYDAKNGVVTLSGNVNSQARRRQVQEVAQAVPNVQQVVNELQIKKQKATSSN
jgi:hyperosmotically inducible protein